MKNILFCEFMFSAMKAHKKAMTVFQCVSLSAW